MPLNKETKPNQTIKKFLNGFQLNLIEACAIGKYFECFSFFQCYFDLMDQSIISPISLFPGFFEVALIFVLSPVNHASTNLCYILYSECLRGRIITHIILYAIKNIFLQNGSV